MWYFKLACFCLSIANVFTASIPELRPLQFTIPEEWNLVPDANYRLRMMHKSEIKLIEPAFEADREVKFILFTRRNPTVGQRFKLGDSLDGSNFNPAHRTRFTIHGWQSDEFSGVNTHIVPAALELDNFNMFVVDWSAGSGTINYIDARNRVFEVARTLSIFIDNLVYKGKCDLRNLIIIGHSLGAHVGGLAAKLVNGNVHTVVALDPAGLLFSNEAPNERVDAKHAEYVEVIHTNGGLLGYFDPIGDADFYPNGGKEQPGCGLDLAGTCAHRRSQAFYGESLITNVGFWAIKCANFEEIKKGKCTSSGKMVALGGDPTNHGKANVLSQCERLRLKNTLAAKKSGQDGKWFLPDCDPETGHWGSIQCLKQQIDTKPDEFGLNVCWCSDKKGAPLTRGGQLKCNHRQARRRMGDGDDIVGEPVLEQLIQQMTMLNDNDLFDNEQMEVDRNMESNMITEMTAVTEKILILANTIENVNYNKIKKVDPESTRCQSLKLTASFPVECDDNGSFLPTQCNDDVCWCVNSAGNQLPYTNTFKPGTLQCTYTKMFTKH